MNERRLKATPGSIRRRRSSKRLRCIARPPIGWNALIIRPAKNRGHAAFSSGHDARGGKVTGPYFSRAIGGRGCRVYHERHGNAVAAGRPQRLLGGSDDEIGGPLEAASGGAHRRAASHAG